MCRGSSTIGFAPNPLLFDAPTCRLLSFPSRLGCSRSVSRTPTCVFRSFPCGIESFPYGIKSFPHGNDLRQVLAKSIHCSDIRFSYVVWPRSHMVLSHSHMVLSSFHLAWSRRRFVPGLGRFAWFWRRMTSGDSDIAPCQTYACCEPMAVSLRRTGMVPAPRKPSPRCGWPLNPLSESV